MVTKYIQIQKIYMEKTDFYDQFQKLMIRNKRISYNLKVMRQFGVVWQSRDLQLSHTRCICEVFVFASLYYLNMMYLFTVMIH